MGPRLRGDDAVGGAVRLRDNDAVGGAVRLRGDDAVGGAVRLRDNDAVGGAVRLRGDGAEQKVARDFEALFIAQLLKAARAAHLADDPLAADDSAFRDAQDRDLAQRLAAAAPLGVAKLLTPAAPLGVAKRLQ